MSDHTLPLATDFAAATEAQWRGLVEKVLKGGDFARRLVTSTADGVAVQPLYTRKDSVAIDVAARGPTRSGTPWDIRQLHVDHDPAAANAAILEDLAGGVTSIALQIAAPGWFGLDYHEAALERALRGVMLDVCPDRAVRWRIYAGCSRRSDGAVAQGSAHARAMPWRVQL